MTDADSDSKSTTPWYGRFGFVVSAALVALLVVGGGYLLLVRPAVAPGASPSAASPSTAPSSPSASPTGEGCPAPATEELRAGMTLQAAPKDTTWTALSYSSIASIDGQGPARTEASGYRRCYAHTLNGAALAAANYSAQIVDPDLWEDALRLGAVQEPGMEEQITKMRNEGVNRAGDKFTVVGLTQVTATSADSVTVGLVLVVGDGTVGADLALQWDGQDWRTQPRVDFQKNIDDYMTWGS